MNARCPGCGATLQHDAPDRPGYLPADLGNTDGSAVCRRCYRLTHYNRAEGRPLAAAEARRQISKALARADAVLLVTEAGDFEGCLPPEGFLPPGKPVILAVNKIDLLPPKAQPREVADWVRARWREAGRGPAASAVVTVSATHGTGLSRLFQALREHGGPGRTWAVAGATSVGKSSLMRRLLAAGGVAREPTVSRFPGTTQAVMTWHLAKDGFTILDTPGFLPGDRLTDLLCPSCAAKLVAARAFTSRLFGIDPGQALVFGGFAAFILAGDEPRTILAYAGEDVSLHRTGAEKAGELLKARPEWLLPWACAECRPPGPWQEQELTLSVGEDLAVAGLGWISLRGGPAPVRVVWPQGVRLVRRPAIFFRRTPVRAGGKPAPARK